MNEVVAISSAGIANSSWPVVAGVTICHDSTLSDDEQYPATVPQLNIDILVPAVYLVTLYTPLYT